GGAWPNGSAALFTSAKIAHLSLLPQGQPERADRVLNMIEAMDREGFGNCTMHRECEAVCPKEISTRFISKMNHEYLRAAVVKRKENKSGGGAGQRAPPAPLPLNTPGAPGGLP